MGLAIIAWRLCNASGQPAQCIVNERDRRWQVIVREGPRIVLAERCESDDVAFERANEIWRTMVEQGWTEPAP